MGAAALLLAGCLAPAADLAPANASGAALACDPCLSVVDETQGAGWEPHVAVDPLDGQHVVAATRATSPAPPPGLFALRFDVHASWDGGRSWNTTTVTRTEPYLSRGDPNAPNVVGDPVLAFFPDGTLLMTGAEIQLVFAGAGVVLREIKLYTWRSTDGGLTFEEPVLVARSEGAFLQTALPEPLPGAAAGVLVRIPDKPWLATGPDGTALLAWADIRSATPATLTDWRSDVMVVASRDSGRSWGEPSLAAPGTALEGPSPVIAADGAWHVAYVDLDARRAHVATSRDEGASWSDQDVMASAWMPSLAAAGPRLWLVASPPVGEGKVDAAKQQTAVAWSDDGGATWSEPLVLDEPEAPGRTLPSAAVAPDGTLFVTFAHAVNDKASTFHAVALRPEGTRANLTLDDAIHGPTTGMGDYLGLGAGPDGAFGVWSTTKDGKAWDVVGAALRVS